MIHIVSETLSFYIGEFSIIHLQRSSTPVWCLFCHLLVYGCVEFPRSDQQIKKITILFLGTVYRHFIYLCFIVDLCVATVGNSWHVYSATSCVIHFIFHQFVLYFLIFFNIFIFILRKKRMRLYFGTITGNFRYDHYNRPLSFVIPNIAFSLLKLVQSSSSSSSNKKK